MKQINIDQPATSLVGPFDLVSLEKQVPLDDEEAMFLVWQEWVEKVVPLLKSLSTRQFSISRYDGSENFSYAVACEASEFESLPEDLPRLLIPQQRCLQFHYLGHPNDIPDILANIWTSKIPALGLDVDTSRLIQIYNMDSGQISDDMMAEIYIPLKE